MTVHAHFPGMTGCGVFFALRAIIPNLVIPAKAGIQVLNLIGVSLMVSIRKDTAFDIISIE